MTDYVGKYKCEWPGCGLEFEACFKKFETKSKRQGGTSAVVCPRCRNKLKPIIDAITIREVKEKVKRHG